MAEPTPLYLRAIAAWGAASQMDMLYEEIGELLTAIGHARRGRGTVADIAGEIADVRIMLDQLCVILECGDLADARKVEKLARLEARLDERDAREKRKMEPL